MPSNFEIDTAVERIDRDRYTAAITERWSVGSGPNGGFTAALLLRTAIAYLDDASFEPRTFTAHLVAAPNFEPCTVHATLERQGRTAAFVTLRLTQQKATCATAMVAFVRPLAVTDRFVRRQPPTAPPPQSVSTRDIRRLTPPHIANYDQRFVTPPQLGDHDAHIVGWTRFVDPQPFDHVALAAIGDSFPPPLLACTTHLLGALTVDYTVHFRAPLPHASIAADGFVLAEFESTAMQDGMVDTDGWLWAPDGTLLAQARQLGIVRPLTDAAAS